MGKINKPRPLLDALDFARVNWRAQFLGNAFFGLPLVVVNCLSEGFSLEAVVWISLLYIALYSSFFIPFFGVMARFFIQPLRPVLDHLSSLPRDHQFSAAERLEVRRTLENLLNLPTRFALIVGLSVPPSFIAAAILLRFNFIPEFMPFINVVSGITISLGLVVAAVHAFLVYVFAEGYLRTAVEFLESRLSFTPSELKIARISLFRKIFFLVLLSVAAAQLSLATFFLGKVGMALPDEFGSTLLAVAVVVFLSFSFVIVITAAFARNLTYPLQKLIRWAGVVTKGGAQEDISVATNDELSEVVEYLRRMVHELKESKSLLEIKVVARTKELQELADGLEEQVKERTNELQEKLKELERINRLAVGRELKMIELKKEIHDLRAELDQIQLDPKKKNDV